MKLLFDFGFFEVYFFGAMVALGALAGILLTVWQARRKGLPPDKALDLTVWTLLGGIVGARLGYILFYSPMYYVQNPLDIVMIQNGGLSIHGGILGGSLVAIYYIKRNKLPLWQFADILAPSLILGQAIGRIGCDVFGIPMEGVYPWGVWVGGTLVHPVQIYEVLLDYSLFAYLWLKRDRAKYQGQIFVHYLIGYALIRGAVEFLRTNPVIIDPFSVSHLLSLITIAAGFFLSLALKTRYPLPPVMQKKSGMVTTIVITAIGMILSVLLFFSVQGG